jgi:hypothetical protein
VDSDDRGAGDAGRGRVARRAGGEAGVLGRVQGDRALVRRAAALLALLAALLVYDAFAGHLPRLSTWWDVAVLSLVLLPGSFALVWLALPLRRQIDSGRLTAVIVVLAVVTAALELAGLDVVANYAKFATVTLVGWWFLTFFEAVTWVLLVALLIVPVDIFSVARGPTKHIVEKQPQVFDVLSIAFPIPGEHTSAQLGLPDVLFFSLFVAAAQRFGLRVGWTWVACVASFALTMVGAVALDVAGLPALPLLSAGFVLVNADLLWHARRGAPA